MVRSAVILFSFILGIVPSTFLNEPDQLIEKAAELSKKYLIVDSHVDVPYRLKNQWEDISMASGGHFDYQRALKGGLNSAFMSIYIPPRYEESGGSVQLADSLISLVEFFTKKYPDKFIIALSADEVIKYKDSDIITLPMGMENGTPIEGSFENLKYFYDRGIRYITLAHGKTNHICDSSYDPNKKWNGLSPFGKSLITEMNKIGMIIDVSHVSDSAFYQIIELSQTPVIASHSSCRYFTPGFERNMNDDMIKKLADNGGVIQINFGSYFISSDYQKKMEKMGRYLKEHNIGRWSEEGKRYFEKFVKENNVDFGSAKTVADHIDHVVKLVGIDYVGLGSDFDGISTLPHGIKDVSSYPSIIYELLKKGYSEKDIGKICSGNILRVWKEVEQYSGNNDKY
ncbi:MAG: dipeptidase [Melioribacteraceae bacterium]|nr:dipeptidase [Melioribacteraceae bacterium]